MRFGTPKGNIKLNAQFDNIWDDKPTANRNRYIAGGHGCSWGHAWLLLGGGMGGIR